jgi:hypothetical protein
LFGTGDGGRFPFDRGIHNLAHLSEPPGGARASDLMAAQGTPGTRRTSLALSLKPRRTRRRTSLSLIPAEFWIVIFTERLRLRGPREKVARTAPRDGNGEVELDDVSGGRVVRRLGCGC